MQSVYFNKKCNFFYIGLLGLCLILILATLIVGPGITDNGWFIFAETCVNLLVTVDYLFRLKMAGSRKFFFNNVGKPRKWNWFDTFVVCTCNLMFFCTLVIKQAVAEEMFDGIQYLFLLIWCVWQLMRMALIAKKQRIARQNAQTLINFENIVVDTEFGATSFRASISMHHDSEQAEGKPRMDSSTIREWQHQAQSKA